MTFRRAHSTVPFNPDNASRRGSLGVERPHAVACEPLESRLLYYALSGTQWASPNISASFVPDGAVLDGGRVSALFAHLDAQHSAAEWQREFARALQTWAQYSPLNFHFVSDDGSLQGSSGSAQGDPRFGDVRLSATPTDSLGFAWFPSTTTRGGDLTLSTKYQYGIGSVYDLYSVLLHESGHALGLEHSLDTTAVMSGSTAFRVVTDLSPDDIAGIQAIYGARQHDSFDASGRNDSSASATRLSTDASGVIGATADLTGLGDVDHYGITVPTGSDGTLSVSIDARGLSLLAPTVRVYDESGNLVASASAGDAYGTAATVTLSGLVAGQKYVIVADGASDDVFGTGAYRLNAKFGMGVSPTPSPTPTPTPTPTPSPAPAIEPDRYESNDTLTSASDLGRTSGFTQAGLTVHSSADHDYYRFVPSRNGTYVVSAVGGQGMSLRLTVLDGAQQVLAGGPRVTLTLSAGQVYYIDVADSAGACGSYDLSLVKTSNGVSGNKKGFLRVPGLAGDGLYLDESAERSGHGPHSASTPLLMEELQRLADAHVARARG